MTVQQKVAQELIDRLKKAEETGERYYWVKPFGGGPNRPFSYEGSPYTGINRILLDQNSEYLTYNKMMQIAKRDNKKLSIRKGAKAKIIVRYCESVAKDKSTGESIIDEETGQPVINKCLKYYHVFSREQIIDENAECLPSKFSFNHFEHENMDKYTVEVVNRAHSLARLFCKKYGISLEINRDGTSAYFSPSENRVSVPRIDGFQCVYSYLETLFHELSHATGLPLNRIKENHSIEDYSREELVADISSQIILSELRVFDDRENTKYVNNNLAYIQGWVKYLEDKPNEILVAASQAEKASQLILDAEKELAKEEQGDRSDDDARE